MDDELQRLDRWLKATSDPELTPATGIDPTAPNASTERKKLAIEVCKRLQLIGADGSPIPQALEVINKHIPNF